MAKFGGASKFGSVKYGGDVAGFDPGHVCDRLISQLSRFLLVDPSDGSANAVGFARTVGRLVGDLRDEEIWSVVMLAGTPAILVHYGGGRFDKTTGITGGYKAAETATFSVICVDSNFRSRIERFEGKRQRTGTAPGLDRMTRMALSFAWRELLGLGRSMKNPRPHQVRYLSLGNDRFVSVVEFQGEVVVSGAEDWPSAVLEKLGICHNPKNLATLFLGDNITPNTDDPTSPSSGVADLTED
jgi:hypothetical protein